MITVLIAGLVCAASFVKLSTSYWKISKFQPKFCYGWAVNHWFLFLKYPCSPADILWQSSSNFLPNIYNEHFFSDEVIQLSWLPRIKYFDPPVCVTWSVHRNVKDEESSLVVREPRGPTVHPPPPPPPPSPPGTFHYGPKMYLRVSRTQSHLFPRCTGVIALCTRYPLAFSRSLTERRSLKHHLNHLYIIVLWCNGPNVV